MNWTKRLGKSLGTITLFSIGPNNVMNRGCTLVRQRLAKECREGLATSKKNSVTTSQE